MPSIRFRSEFESLTNILTQNINSESHNKAKIKVNEFKTLFFKNPEKYIEFIDLGFNNYINNKCPFCQRELNTEELLDIYKNFFDEIFDKYKQDLYLEIDNFLRINVELIKQTLSSKLEDNLNLLKYWKEKIPDLKNLISLTLEEFILLKEKTDITLKRKKEDINLSYNLTDLNLFGVELGVINHKIDEYNEIIKLNNEKINLFKKSLGEKNIIEINKEQSILNNIISRFTNNKTKYDEFKKQEELLEQYKKELDIYTETVKTEYLTLINKNLKSLNLRNLELKEINSEKKGTAKDFNVEIVLKLENCEINMNSKSEDEPAFNNTLSNGEKNALAFAFFLAQLEKTENLDNKILVFDDPLTSLDDDRKRQVSLEIKKFDEKSLQTIVLTHKNSFLKILFDCNKNNVKTFELKKDSNGSKLFPLDMTEYLKEDFIKKLEKLHKFLENDFEYPELENDIRQVLERVISTKHYIKRKKLGKTIVTYDGFNTLFWSENKLIDEKSRILSICKIANDESHDDICEPIIYENLSYDEKKGIILEVFELIEKI